MSNRILVPTLLTSLIAALGLFALANPAFAQRSVPVTVENDETEPIPVYQAGRIPYQFTYYVSTSSTGEDCDTIPVPDGMMLTVTSVGVEAQIHNTDNPDVYLRSTRSTGSGSALYRFRARMEYQSSANPFNYYTGIYETTLHVGAADDPVSYYASICVSGGSGGSNNARGVVTGYVEPASTIIDGNSLP